MVIEWPIVLLTWTCVPEARLLTPHVIRAERSRFFLGFSACITLTFVQIECQPLFVGDILGFYYNVVTSYNNLPIFTSSEMDSFTLLVNASYIPG